MQMKFVGGSLLQTFSPDAGKSQVTTGMTGTKIFKKGTGADVNINEWVCIRVNSAAAGTYYFNSDSTKTFPLPIGTSDVYVASDDIVQVTITFGAGTNYVQGM
jgi:hypothetical protein